MDDEPKKPWRHEHESILKKWGEKALCYRWLHDKSYKKFWNITISFNIPTIILSTITGAANFALQSIVPTDYQLYAQVGIGTFSILAGILQTISSYLQVESKSEGHRVSNIAWGKLGRNITIELTKVPDERQDPMVFIDICRNEYDRLIEQSPDIPEDILELFKEKIDKHFSEVSIPDVCNGVEPIIPSVTNHIDSMCQTDYVFEKKGVEIELKNKKRNVEVLRDIDDNISIGHVSEIRKKFQKQGLFRTFEDSLDTIESSNNTSIKKIDFLDSYSELSDSEIEEV